MIQRLCGLDLWLMGGDVADGLKKDIKEDKKKLKNCLKMSAAQE